MTSLRCADCGELFREIDHPQCWRETGKVDELGGAVEIPICRDCLREEWLERSGQRSGRLP